MLRYIVQPGDTLYLIGLKFQATVNMLMDINHITDAHMIYPGQLLNIPLPFSPNGGTRNFPSIRKGSTGPFVLLLQSQLSRLGFYTGAMDGIFGSTTEGSVVQFQISRSLHSTGIVGVPTWKHLLDDNQSSLDAPPFHAQLVLAGLFMVLSVDKPTYGPNNTMILSLLKINLSNTTITLNYNTSQRYEFKVTYPSGRTLWRWSDSLSFTQVLGTLTLSPGQSVRYTEEFKLPHHQKDSLYHIYGWNTAKQINHIKNHVTIKTTSN